MAGPVNAETVFGPMQTTQHVGQVQTMRRFEVPDMSSKGFWMMARISQLYPHMSERQLVGWLKGLVFNSAEFLFLQQDHSVALCQKIKLNVLDEFPSVHELFVFVEDRENKQQLVEASEFYAEFARWAKQNNADELIVGNFTDIPLALIERKIGKVGKREQLYARI